MIFLDYLTGNFEMAFELVGLLLMLGISVHISEQMKRWTRLLVILLFVESLSFHLEKWTQSFETLSPLRVILTIIVYSLYPFIIIVMMRMLFDNISRKQIIILLVPQLICILLYSTSQWTHLVFWFEAYNRWRGGTISILPYIMFVFYALIFLLMNILYFKNYSGTKALTFIYFYITVVPILSVFYYKFIDEGKDYCALFSSAILLYFIMVYIHMARTDPLTGLLNRLSYNIKYTNKVTGVISIDVNGLKSINDSEGHNAGDLALITVANILKSYCGKHAMVYRVGGDEFVVLYTKVDEKDIVDVINTMQEKLAQTDYSCSFGYAMVNSEGDVSKAIAESDVRMYSEKNKYYANCKKNTKRSVVTDENDT